MTTIYYRYSTTIALFVAVQCVFACGQAPSISIPEQPKDQRVSIQSGPNDVDHPNEWGRTDWPDAVVIDDPEEAFDRLTRTQWLVGAANTRSTVVEFRREGSFTWLQMPGPPCGTPDFQRGGPWTLRWYGTHGHVVLHLGSMIAVQFRGDQLFFGGGVLNSGEPIEYDGEALAATLADLPMIDPDPLYERLAANDWRKSNNYYLSMYPERLSFDRNGRCYAGYRKGECGHGAFWSVIVGRGHRGLKANLLTFADENLCDVRNPDEPQHSMITHSNAVPRFDDDLLLFYGSSYLPADSAPNLYAFSFDRYTDSVRVTGRYRGELRPGVTTSIAFRFEHCDRRGNFTLNDFRIMQLPDDATGLLEPTTLYDSPLDFHLTRQGDCYEQVIEVTPVSEGEGRIGFTIELEYESTRQDYHGYGTYSNLY